MATICPFLVGFDTPDSAGTTIGASAGRGTYHLVGCKGKFDSEFWEGQVSAKHRFESDTARPHSFWSKVKPDHNTVGAFVDAIGEDMTVVDVFTDSLGNPKIPDTIGTQFEKRGFAGGFYWTGDWKWVGLTLGWCGLYRKSEIADLDVQGFKQPVFGLRLGDFNRFYVSLDAYGSSPTLSGGGSVNLGLGAKWHDTRLWLGTGQYPGKQKDSKGLGILKVSQALGPYTLSFVAQGNGEDVPPANLGIDREYGLALSLEYRLPY